MTPGPACTPLIAHRHGGAPGATHDVSLEMRPTTNPPLMTLYCNSLQRVDGRSSRTSLGAGSNYRPLAIGVPTCEWAQAAGICSFSRETRRCGSCALYFGGWIPSCDPASGAWWWPPDGRGLRGGGGPAAYTPCVSATDNPAHGLSVTVAFAAPFSLSWQAASCTVRVSWTRRLQTLGPDCQSEKRQALRKSIVLEQSQYETPGLVSRSSFLEVGGE